MKSRLTHLAVTIFVFFFSMQEVGADDGSGQGVNFTGWEKHYVARRLEANLIAVEQGAFI